MIAGSDPVHTVAGDPTQASQYLVTDKSVTTIGVECHEFFPQVGAQTLER